MKIETHEGLPLFQVTAEPNPTAPGSYVVTFKCPFCRSRHGHGTSKPLEGDQPFRRGSHCNHPAMRAGYFISTSEWVARQKGDENGT